MKKFSHALSVAVLTCSLFALSSTPAHACGPSFILPVFAMDSRPEQFENFAKGNIGIIYPAFNRSALLVAYREFNNLPFSAKEQQDLVRNWQAEYDNADANEANKDTAINNWIAARKQVAGNEAEPKIYTDRTNPESYSSFTNCTAGAFDNATKTLAARIEKNKAEDVNVKDWLRGQDQVFANCSEAKEMPSPVAADAPEWLKNDRDYQLAAAYFYATQYDEAKICFAQIAKNTASPWRDISAYLLARIAFHQASAISEEEAKRDQMLAYYKQAEDQLNSVLADARLASVHEPAKQLLNLISFRLHPETLHETLAKKLLNSAENPTLFQDVTDYCRLLDKATFDEETTEEGKSFNAKFRQNSELTDWIFTVQFEGKDAYPHAVEKWQATKNPAWLVASLMKASADSPKVANLITAGLAIDKASPAFASANFHAVRLQIALGKIDEARKALDVILRDTSSLTGTATNQFLAERLQLAQKIDNYRDNWWCDNSYLNDLTGSKYANRLQKVTDD